MENKTISTTTEKKRWPFSGFFLELSKAQKEYEQEQHIDPASLTEEERRQKIQEILDYMHAPRKKKKEDDEPLDPIVPENDLEAVREETEKSLPRKQYIADLVGDDFKHWKGIVVFDAGTNSGKTYFILKVLLPWAYEHRKRILILCNRDALRNQIQRDVCRLGRVAVSYEDYDEEGRQVERTAIENKYENTIHVETYQWLETFLQKNMDAAKTYLRAFDYIVSDEYHYMVTDASFNDNIELSYEAIKELYHVKTCIFMSATARPFFDYWEKKGMIPAGQHYRLPVDYSFVAGVKFFYYEDEEIDIIRRVKPGEKILVFVETIAKLRKLRDRLKAEGIEDVACLCSKYRPEAKEFDRQDDVLKGGVLVHQVTLTTTTLYNGVDMKDCALKYIVSELWNPIVNAQILGRKRPLSASDTCAVYFMHYGVKRLEGLDEDIRKYQFEPVQEYRKKFHDSEAWQKYLNDNEVQMTLKKCRTIKLDARKGCYCWRNRAYLQALVEEAVLNKMVLQGYQEVLLKEIDETLLEKVEQMDQPLLVDYLEEHLDEKKPYKDWQKIFYKIGHIYNRDDEHRTKSMPKFGTAADAIEKYGYELHTKKENSGVWRDKTVWWVTKMRK